MHWFSVSCIFTHPSKKKPDESNWCCPYAHEHGSHQSRGSLPVTTHPERNDSPTKSHQLPIRHLLRVEAHDPLRHSWWNFKCLPWYRQPSLHWAPRGHVPCHIQGTSFRVTLPILQLLHSSHPSSAMSQELWNLEVLGVEVIGSGLGLYRLGNTDSHFGLRTQWSFIIDTLTSWESLDWLRPTLSCFSKEGARRCISKHLYSWEVHLVAPFRRFPLSQHPTPPPFCAQIRVLVNVFSHVNSWLCSLPAERISDFAFSVQPPNRLCFALFFCSFLTQVLTMQPKLASQSSFSRLGLMTSWIIGSPAMPAPLTHSWKRNHPDFLRSII